MFLKGKKQGVTETAPQRQQGIQQAIQRPSTKAVKLKGTPTMPNLLDYQQTIGDGSLVVVDDSSTITVVFCYILLLIMLPDNMHAHVVGLMARSIPALSTEIERKVLIL